MIGHRSLAACVNRTEHGEHVVGRHLAGQYIAPNNVGRLTELPLHIGPRRFVIALQMRNVALEKIGDSTGARIPCDLDTTAVENELCVVSVEDSPCFGERHRRVRS
jgi:hypothetical protein